MVGELLLAPDGSALIDTEGESSVGRPGDCCCGGELFCFVPAIICPGQRVPPDLLVPHLVCVEFEALTAGGQTVIFRDQIPGQGLCWQLIPNTPSLDAVPPSGFLISPPLEQFKTCEACVGPRPPEDCWRRASLCLCETKRPRTTPYFICEDVEDLTEEIIFVHDGFCWGISASSEEVSELPPDGVVLGLAGLTTFANCDRCCGCIDCFDLQEDSCPDTIFVRVGNLVLDPDFPHPDPAGGVICRLIPFVTCPIPKITPTSYQDECRTGISGTDCENRALVTVRCEQEPGEDPVWRLFYVVQMQALDPETGICEICEGSVTAIFTKRDGCICPCGVYILESSNNINPAFMPTAEVVCP
jgi:hypothetical protein